MTRISDAIKQDHALIRRAYRQLSSSNPDNRNPDEFIWVLDRYLMVEDLVLTPALEHHIAQGGERHNRLARDYDSIHEKLLRMKQFNPTDQSFESSLKAIWVDLEPHIREEATSDLDRLEESLSKSDSEALGKRYEDIKELLQRPYGEGGTPDAHTLSAILEMPRQELMVKLGIRGE
ncbi:hypothetical protein N656DRAFT_763866 [Canariomyces notabilis]|uniref:Hemerythrin-like domain-containing protein n=1 Tax=Canariomyces notabilis TaxID=2074819 RepID=A0AAN6T6Q8_9PEZI|nr:hypothetical protein N656DRAFT_763866 [Canariomyces arenarius]